ncbi:hypothetical protein B0H63DRAFT_529888 [Podospora didyma]|uniref:Proteasome activator Blm10 middle HEAT repeats region domain-containing protein n=1 Tax=Podospora didyma TaxID=330526 RepID=A0AAE0N0M6_9PEZI|nr:hypothetical protein B0H63DRAFT_529888 [Podospora didyma]
MPLPAAVLQDPDACLAIFVPELIDIETQTRGPKIIISWYTQLLSRCLRLDGESNILYLRQPALDLVQTIEDSSILRALTVSARWTAQLLTSLNTTYAARYNVVSVDHGFDGSPSTGCWGWDRVNTKIIWHVLSSKALSAAYDVFDT